MRFALVLKATQVIRMSAVAFGIIGAAYGSGGCSMPGGSTGSQTDEARSADGKTSHPSAPVKTAKLGKRSDALSQWEASGGGSGEAVCSQYDREFSGTGYSYQETRSYAEEEAREIAERAAEDKCEDSSGVLCKATAGPGEELSMDCEDTGVRGRNRWRCHASYSVECTYSIF